MSDAVASVEHNIKHKEGEEAVGDIRTLWCFINENKIDVGSDAGLWHVLIGIIINQVSPGGLVLS